MAKHPPKVVLFLDHTPPDRARIAETEFNAVATKLGLPWVARVLPITTSVALDTASLESAAVVIAFGKATIEPHVLERSPDRVGGIEYWEIVAGSETQAGIARQVSGLVARLLGGRIVADEPKSPPVAKEPPKKAHTVRVGRETAGRRGKGVTTVTDLPLTMDAMQELATALKQKCGTGGTAKDGRIEIQGDHRDRIVVELEKLGYKVKRSGG